MPSHSATSPTNMESSRGFGPRPRFAMGGHIGSEGVLPPSESPPIHREVDEILVPESRLPMPGNAVRMVNVPLLVPQIGEANPTTIDRVGDPPQLVCGRHPHIGSHGSGNGAPSPEGCQIADSTRDPSECREIHEQTSTICHLPGPQLEPRSQQDLSIGAQDSRGIEIGETPTEGAGLYSQALDGSGRAIVGPSQEQHCTNGAPQTTH